MSGMTTTTPDINTDTSDQPDHWISVRDAARLLNVSERHAQRVAARLPDQARRKTPNGPTYVLVSALPVSQTVNPTAPDTPDTGPTIEATASDTDRTALEAQAAALEQRVVELTRQVSDLTQQLSDTRADKDRLFTLMSQAHSDASEWRRLLVMSNPRLLPPGPDTPERPPEPVEGPWWAFWKRHG